MSVVSRQSSDFRSRRWPGRISAWRLVSAGGHLVTAFSSPTTGDWRLATAVDDPMMAGGGGAYIGDVPYGGRGGRWGVGGGAGGGGGDAGVIRGGSGLRHG